MLTQRIKILSNMACMLVVVGLMGCASMDHAQPNDPNFAPMYPEPVQAPAVANGSLFQDDSANMLFGDRKPHRVGDIITVRLVEKTSAEKSSETDVSKDSRNVLGLPTVFGSTPTFNLPGVIPMASNQGNTLETNIRHQREFSGAADSKQSNKLEGDITVTVYQVLANGNLLIRGEKWLTLNQGDEYIRLSGMVRPDDIDANNSVISTRIANARISYSGRGDLADANKNGWLQRFFNSGFWPF